MRFGVIEVAVPADVRDADAALEIVRHVSKRRSCRRGGRVCAATAVRTLGRSHRSARIVDRTWTEQYGVAATAAYGFAGYGIAVIYLRRLHQYWDILSADDGFTGFEWDRDKSDRTFAERDFDFETAAKVFTDIYLEEPSIQRDYGEPRFKVIGCADDKLLAVVWTPRGSNRRIISARRCRPDEKDAYDEHRSKIS